MNTYAQNQAGAVNQIPDRPKPNSPVFNALEGLAKRISELHENIQQLGEKLSPVLRPSPVQICGKTGQEPPSGESDLTQTIRRYEQDIAGLVHRVSELRESSDV